MSKREGKKILSDAKRAGEDHVYDQTQSDYFMHWLHGQVYEASQMDPSQVLPLETKADAKVVAKNTLQQLGWDVKRNVSPRDILELSGASGVFDVGSADWVLDKYGIDESDVVDAFYEGFDKKLQSRELVDWLADEILLIHEGIVGRSRSTREPGEAHARKRRAPEIGGGAFEFAELLKSLVDTQGRYLGVRTEHRLGGPAHYYENVYVSFINLPEEIVARKAGGGAEAQNNKMSFWVEGFNGSDPHAPPPTGKVKVEMQTSALPREYRLRAKTAPPGAIAQYLADFINKVVREVPPNYTHSRVDEGHVRERQQPRRRLPPSKDIPVPAVPVYPEGDPNANYAIETLVAHGGRRTKWRFDSGYYATIEDAIAMSENLILFGEVGWYKGVRVVDVRRGYKPVWEWPERKGWFGREGRPRAGEPRQRRRRRRR